MRTSSDLRLNPHLHLVVLDGAWHEDGKELAWEALSLLRTSEGGALLERVVRRTALRPAPDPALLLEAWSDSGRPFARELRHTRALTVDERPKDPVVVKYSDPGALADER